MKIKKCIRCHRLIDELEHGNRLRCPLCAILHKRTYNRNKQRIIREIGNPGLKNFQILEQISALKNWTDPHKTSIDKLVRRGFNFSQGGITQDATFSQNYLVIVVINYEVYYNLDDQGQSVIIKKNESAYE